MRMTRARSIGADRGAERGTRVTRLRLAHYRSHEALDLDLGTGGGHGPIVLLGPNGAGKTNLLEAISWLAPGRGLRAAPLAEVTRHGSAAPWAVHARLAVDGEAVEIGTGLPPGGQGEGARRIVRIDGETASGPAALAGHVAMLWLTPAMDRMFLDPSSARRRFLDRVVLALHPAHGRHAAAFERAMRERNRLLAERGPRADPAWLEALEGRMAEQAVAIAAARRETVDALALRMTETGEDAFPPASAELSGWLEERLADAPALEVEDAYRELLARNRARDAAAGRTLEGPHRGDLAVRHRAKDMPARQCSTGEQKGLLLGLLLANLRLVAELGPRPPMLLLDEVAAHLDAARRRALFARLDGLASQVWMTGTDSALFDDLGAAARRFAVSPGALRPF